MLGGKRGLSYHIEKADDSVGPIYWGIMTTLSLKIATTLLAFLGVGVADQIAAQQAGPTTRMARQLLQVVNTLEAHSAKVTGAYRPLEDLLSSQEFAETATKWNLAQHVDSRAYPNVLSGFGTAFRMTNVGYDMLLVDLRTGSAFATSQDGVIYEGVALDPVTHKASVRFDHFVPGARQAPQ